MSGVEGTQPRSVAVRAARWGYVWRLHLWRHGRGAGYVVGWRPTKAGAERAGRRAFERAEQRFLRLNAWRPPR